MKILGRPLWATLLAILLLLPLGFYPALLGRLQPESATLVKLYPLYAIFTAWLAWLCYPRRREMYWILLGLLLLSHAAVWLLPRVNALT